MTLLFFFRFFSSAHPKSRSVKRGKSREEWKEIKRGEKGKGSLARRFVLYVTSLLSVSGSNRAAVAGNCSSLLPGAPRVQSRIHEFLVRSLPYVPSPTSPPPPASPTPPVPTVPSCARVEYLTRTKHPDGKVEIPTEKISCLDVFDNVFGRCLCRNQFHPDYRRDSESNGRENHD